MGVCLPVTFEPQRVGTYQGRMMVSCDSGASIEVILSGEAIDHPLVVKPHELHFSRHTQKATLKLGNYGEKPLPCTFSSNLSGLLFSPSLTLQAGSEVEIEVGLSAATSSNTSSSEPPSQGSLEIVCQNKSWKILCHFS